MSKTARARARTHTHKRRETERQREGTSYPFLKERTAERTLTAMQRMAQMEVRTLKHRQMTRKGSGLARTLRPPDPPPALLRGCEFSPPSAPSCLAIFLTPLPPPTQGSPAAPYKSSPPHSTTPNRHRTSRSVYLWLRLSAGDLGHERVSSSDQESEELSGSSSSSSSSSSSELFCFRAKSRIPSPAIQGKRGKAVGQRTRGGRGTGMETGTWQSGTGENRTLRLHTFAFG